MTTALTIVNFLLLVANVSLISKALRSTAEVREAVGRLEAPEPPNLFPVYLMGDEVTMLAVQELRQLTVDLVNTSGYEIVLIDRHDTDEGIDAPEEMRWRAEVWYAHRHLIMAVKSAIDGPEKVPSEEPGILGVPLWLNNGPTPGSVTQLAAEWIVKNPVMSR